MNSRKYGLLLLLVFTFLFNTIPAQQAKQDTELAKKLKALPGVVEVKEARFTSSFFSEAYEVMVQQPLDQSHPKGEKFQQRFFVSHKDYTSPVMLETEGYTANSNPLKELTRILNGNQVIVEHRYFGRSVPKGRRWQYLTLKNAAADMHHIVTLLKTIYKGKWVSSGTSKGGQTTLFYKYFYPNDVDASVPYVAPINVAQEDPRIYIHLQNVGSPECRKKIKEYQIAMFKREDELLPLVKAAADKRNYVFSMGLSQAYEYAVLEYLFTFWQYGPVSCDNIPAPDAPKEVMVDHFMRTDALDFFTDASIKGYEPFFYQAYSEIGFYNYDVTGFRQYMKTVKRPTDSILCPKDAKIVYNPQTLQNVYHFLQYEGNNIIYIYGEWDTWGATQVQLIGQTNSIKLVKKEGFHSTRISQLSPEQKDIFYNTLESWLGVKLNRI